jgi:hypothetical protein
VPEARLHRRGTTHVIVQSYEPSAYLKSLLSE